MQKMFIGLSLVCLLVACGTFEMSGNVVTDQDIVATQQAPTSTKADQGQSIEEDESNTEDLISGESEMTTPNSPVVEDQDEPEAMDTMTTCVDSRLTDSLTGLDDLDRIIKAVLFANADEMRELFYFTETACTTAGALGGPPQCAEDELEGSIVTVLPVLGPGEGSYSTPENIDVLLDYILSFNPMDLYAVYPVPDDVFEAGYWPAGEYGIAFIINQSAAAGPPLKTLILYVEDGRIVRVEFSMNHAMIEVEQESEDLLLLQCGPDESGEGY